MRKTVLLRLYFLEEANTIPPRYILSGHFIVCREEVRFHGRVFGRKRAGFSDWMVLVQIMATGLAGGLTKPDKGMVPAALTRFE